MINLEKIKEKITKKSLIEIVILTLFAGLLTWFEQEFFTILFIILGLTYVAVFSISYLFSAYLVFSSLLKVATGITLLIFVISSYCEIVPIQLQTLNSEIQNLSVIAIILIIAEFRKDFWNKVKGVYFEIKNDKKEDLHTKIVTGFILLFLTTYIIIQLFRIFYLIINNLCVF